MTTIRIVIADDQQVVRAGFAALLATQPDFAVPRVVSNWSDFDPAGRPRSATVVICKRDGGVIGT